MANKFTKPLKVPRLRLKSGRRVSVGVYAEDLPVFNKICDDTCRYPCYIFHPIFTDAIAQKKPLKLEFKPDRGKLNIDIRIISDAIYKYILYSAQANHVSIGVFTASLFHHFITTKNIDAFIFYLQEGKDILDGLEDYLK